MAAVFFVGGDTLFEVGIEVIFFAFAVHAVGGLVVVGAEGVAEIEAEWVGPEGRVDDGENFLAELLGVIAVIFVETFLEAVIESVDGGLTLLVALNRVEVGFLDEKEDEKERRKGRNDDELEDGEALAVSSRGVAVVVRDSVHGTIIAFLRGIKKTLAVRGQDGVRTWMDVGGRKEKDPNGSKCGSTDWV